jgi:hypothetical protein
MSDPHPEDFAVNLYFEAMDRLKADLATLRATHARAMELLERSAKVMREWTGYDVWKPLHDEIAAFLTPLPPTAQPAPGKP